MYFLRFNSTCTQNNYFDVDCRAILKDISLEETIVYSISLCFQALYMLREPDFLKAVNEADIRKNYEELPSSTEEESLATLKGIRNILVSV